MYLYFPNSFSSFLRVTFYDSFSLHVAYLLMIFYVLVFFVINIFIFLLLYFYTFTGSIGRSWDEETVSFYFYIITFLLFLIFSLVIGRNIQCSYSFLFCVPFSVFSFFSAWDVDRKKMSTANPPGFSNIRFSLGKKH